MAVSFGSELRRHRLRAGRSLAELARAVYYSKGHLSRVETGAKAAGADLARRCDDELGAAGALIAAFEQRTPRGRPGPAAGPDDEPSSHGAAWSVRVGADGAGDYGDAATAWPAPRRGDAHRDGLRHVQTYRSWFDLLRGQGQVTPAGVLLPTLIAHTETVRYLAEAAADRSNPDLWRLAARYAEFTGWMAQETGNDEHALLWTRRAVEFGARGGDHRLRAYALVRRAEIALYSASSGDTVAFAQQAQSLDCGNHVRALAAQREAQGHALAGRAQLCEQALDRAAHLQSEPDDHHSLPPFGTSNVDDPIGMAAGWSFVDLGRPGPATELLRRQLDRAAPTATRMKARITARYALALVGSGQVERGCEQVPQLLDWCADVDSATVRVDLRRLMRALNRWSEAPHVRQVLPELTAAVGPR